MNRYILVIATTLVAVAIFAAGSFFYDRSQKTVIEQIVARSEGALVRPHSPIIGPTEAPVTIVEFLDPSCEACRAFYPITKQILQRFPGDVRLVIRYTPFHDGSEEAVRILETARRQMRFEAILSALFTAQPDWADHGAPNLQKAWSYAGRAGLNLDRARSEANSVEISDVIALDVADVKTFAIKQTPSFFVNGKPLTDFSPQGLLSLVESEVKRTKVVP